MNKDLSNNKEPNSTYCSINNTLLEESSFETTKDKEEAKININKGIRDTRWRWVALALVSLINFGSYFCSDSPNSLSDLIF